MWACPLSKPAENKALSLSKPFLPLRFEPRSRNSFIFSYLPPL